MRFIEWIRSSFYSGYDRRGNAKCLLGRANDPAQCEIEGVSTADRDEALTLLCDSFDIPERQKYCLRPGDELMAIYRSFVGPRSWDEMEFERLETAINELPGAPLSEQESRAIKTVADVVRVVAARRGNAGS
jgi:hypothetical protein